MSKFTLVLMGIIAIIFMGTADIASAQEETGIYAWETNLDEALSQAKEQDKLVFLYFAGTDWCPWCMRFDREILDTGPFRRFAKSNFIPTLIDFPRTYEIPEEQQAYNQALAHEYGVTGFPTVLIINAEGEVIHTGSFEEGGSRRYINNLRRIIR